MCGYNGGVVSSRIRRVVGVVLPLALLVVALLLILRPPSTEYLDLLRRGDDHAARRERAAAVAAYRQAADLRPGDPEPYLRTARVALDWGRTDDALRTVAEAKARDAADVDLERTWIAIHTVRSDWSAVVSHSRRLLGLVPADHVARHVLARAHLELGEWDAARVEYEILLDADPSDALAHERLGALLLGDDPSAIQHLFVAGTELADELITTLGHVSAGDEAYASARLGRVLFEAQEWALAVPHFERALSHAPAYPDAHAYVGYALDQMGHTDEAEYHLRVAVVLSPDSAVGHMFLGLHHDRQGDVSSARAEYETAYDLDPENPAVCVEIGETWLAERRYVAAEIWLRHAVSQQPDDPALWEVLTRFYLDHNLDTMGEGITAAAELVERAPDDARAHDLQGWAAFLTGDYQAAQNSLQRAVSLDPTLASAYYHQGRLWEAIGLYEKAQNAFARALDLDVTGELGPLIERAAERLHSVSSERVQ